MRLNIGCADQILDGYVNVDIVELPGVFVADLRETWPWDDDSVESIRAHDIVEHLPDKIHTMNEMWRVLEPGGKAEIVVPSTNGPAAFQDPTHVSFWNRNSFWYYEAGNPYREFFAEAYGIRASFNVVESYDLIVIALQGPHCHILLEAAS